MLGWFMYYIKRSKTPLGEIKTKDGLIIPKLFQTWEHEGKRIKYISVFHLISLSILTLSLDFFYQSMIV